jgi:secondary thiamine-phosphate synthase enzyme
MESLEVHLTTGDAERVIDLSDRCAAFLADVDATDGLLNVFVPHATAGLAVIETGAGSDDDLLALLEDLVPGRGPSSGGWQHRHGSPGHGRDHVLPAIVAPSVTIPVLDGRMTLGTWQSVVLVDTNVDNRERRVRLSFVRG